MADPAELMNGFCEDCIKLHLLDPSDKHERYIRLRAALLAALSPAPTVPPGFKLVPVEPTERMMEAIDAEFDKERERLRRTGQHVTQESWKAAHERSYTAMLAASPQPPVVEGWRDIASAPRDGTQVLLWQPHWEAMQTAVWFNDGHNRPGWLTMDGGEVIKPSHYRPLPAPPSAPEAGR